MKKFNISNTTKPTIHLLYLEDALMVNWIMMRFFLNFSDKDAAMLSTKSTTVLRILVTALGNVLEKRTGFNDDFKIAIFKKAGIAKRPEKGVRKAVCNYGIVFCICSKKVQLWHVRLHGRQ